MSEAPELGPSARQDLIGGVAAVAFGAAVLAEAWHYPMGSLLRMGPGFFPSGIAALIVALGIVLILGSMRPRQQSVTLDFRLRSVVTIGLGIALFALLLERAGLVVATPILVLVSSLAARPWRPRRAAMLALAMTALVYAIFILVLQLPIPTLVL